MPTEPDVSLIELIDITSGITDEPLVLVCLVSKGNLHEDFDIKSALIGSGFGPSIVPNVAKHKNGHKYNLVVSRSYIELLSARLQGFTLITDYDLFALDDSFKRIHGILAARKKACENAFTIAKESQAQRWTPGSEKCYRLAFAKAGLEREFVEQVIYRDIQVSHSRDSCFVRLLTVIRAPTYGLLSSTKAY